MNSNLEKLSWRKVVETADGEYRIYRLYTGWELNINTFDGEFFVGIYETLEKAKNVAEFRYNKFYEDTKK